MSKLTKNIIIFSIILTLGSCQIFSNVMAASVNELDSNISIESQEVRENLTYIQGKPGDEYLVYTYDENGKHYKVIDKSKENFTNVSSEIYVLNENGQYKLIETQSVEVEEDKLVNFVRIPKNGQAIVRNIPIESNAHTELILSDNNSFLSKSKIPALGAWKSTSISGNKNIANMAVSAIIAVIVAVVSEKVNSTVSKALVNGIGDVANNLYSAKAKTGYYTGTYYWRTLKNNILVIMAEKNNLKWYSNKKKTKYKGTTRYSWSEY